MKTSRKIRFMSLALAMVMLMLSVPTFAYAAETDPEQELPENVVSVEELDNGKIRTVYEFEVTPESVDDDGVATYAIDSSFTMTGTYYRGADRKYSGNYLDYTMIVTSADGSTDRQLSIELWDYNHEYALQTNLVTVNGPNISMYNTPIVVNRTYYFKYYLINGSTTSIKVRMIIDSWS